MKRRTFVKNCFYTVGALTFFSSFCIANENNLYPKRVKFGKEPCKRCGMPITAKNFVVQVINPSDNKRYNFDDIGCAISWFDEQKISWKDKAVIFVADVNTSEWLHANEAYFTFGANTPMHYGYAAFKTEQKGVENFNFTQVVNNIL
ncbi:MAG: hypothetical protein ACK5LP_04215 [Campylobacteraceae bacterium]